MCLSVMAEPQSHLSCVVRAAHADAVRRFQTLVVSLSQCDLAQPFTAPGSTLHLSLAGVAEQH